MLTAGLLVRSAVRHMTVRALATAQATAPRRRARRAPREGCGEVSSPPDATSAASRRAATPAAGLTPRPLKPGAVSGWLTLDGSEHPLKPSDVPLATMSIMRTLRGAGHTAYIVGGAVRDALLGLPPKDYDVLTSAPADSVVALLGERRTRRVGRRFPITLVRAGAGMTEVTSLDLFGAGGGGATAAVTAAAPVCPLAEAAALAASAAARDFTVNALFYDALSPAGLLHDPSGRGIADASARVLRCCGASGPAAVLAADPARVLRAARLAARCSLRVTPATAAAAMESVALVATLPASRQQSEVAAALSAGAASRTLALWRAWGLLDVLLPELDACADAAGVPLAGVKAPLAPGTPRPPRVSSLPGFAAIRALDAAASPSNPSPSGVWMFAVASPVMEARLKGRDGLFAAVVAAKERDPSSPPTPFSVTMAAIDTTLRDMVTMNPRSLSLTGMRQALKVVAVHMHNNTGRTPGGRRAARGRRRAGEDDEVEVDTRWDAVFDVALEWRKWVGKQMDVG